MLKIPQLERRLGSDPGTVANSGPPGSPVSRYNTSHTCGDLGAAILVGSSLGQRSGQLGHERTAHDEAEKQSHWQDTAWSSGQGHGLGARCPDSGLI